MSKNSLFFLIFSITNVIKKDLTEILKLLNLNLAKFTLAIINIWLIFLKFVENYFLMSKKKFKIFVKLSADTELESLKEFVKKENIIVLFDEIEKIKIFSPDLIFFDKSNSKEDLDIIIEQKNTSSDYVGLIFCIESKDDFSFFSAQYDDFMMCPFDYNFLLYKIKLHEKIKNLSKKILETERNKYKILFKSVATAIFIIDKDFNIIETNQAATHLTLYTENELKEMNFFGLFVTKPKNFFEKLATQTNIYRYKTRIFNKIHKIIYVLLNISHIELASEYIISITDITEQHKAQKELKLKTKALDYSQNSVIITDTKAKILWCNRAFMRETGYDWDEIIGTNPKEILKSGLTEIGVYDDMWQTILKGLPWKGEFINRKKDGSLYIEENFISPVFNEYEQISHFIAIKIDVTEKKKIEQMLIAAKNDAEKNNKIKTEFIKNLSHEIRTPMNGIIGFLDLLENEDYDKEKQNVYIQMIKSSAYQLMGVIDELIEISNIEKKEIILRLEKIDVNKLIFELFSMFELEAKSKNNELYIKDILPENQKYIINDKAKLNKILSIFIDNAIKYTTNGRIEIGVKLDKNKIVFFVADNGVGIEKDRLQEIFDFFKQAHLQERYNTGLGLGLAIAKKTADAIKAGIKVDSQINIGSTFYLELEREKKIEQSTKNSESKKIKIILVEDESSNLAYLNLILNKSFPEAVLLHAMNGEEALKLADKHKDADIILMDLKMPIMNGFDAIKQIKKKMPKIPIIVQTAYFNNESRSLAFDSGADDFISKPIDMQVLISKIIGFLNKIDKKDSEF